jgi:flagellar motor switch protein FliN/FliY
MENQNAPVDNETFQESLIGAEKGPEDAATLLPGGLGPMNLGMLMDVSLNLSVELGRTQMTVRQVLALQEGSVVELNRQAGEAVDIFINNHVFARGEVVVVDDKLGVRITELVSPTPKKGL